MAKRWTYERISHMHPEGTISPSYDRGTIKLRDENGRVRFSAPYSSGGVSGKTAASVVDTHIVGWYDSDAVTGYVNRGAMPEIKNPEDREILKEAYKLGYGLKVQHAFVSENDVTAGCLGLEPRDQLRFHRVEHNIPSHLKPTRVDASSSLGFGGAFANRSGGFGNHELEASENSKPLFSGLFNKRDNDREKESSSHQRKEGRVRIETKRDDVDNERKPLFSRKERDDDDKPERGQQQKQSRERDKDDKGDKKDFGDVVRGIGKALKGNGGEMRESRGEVERPQAGGKGLGGLFKGNRH